MRLPYIDIIDINTYKINNYKQLLRVGFGQDFIQLLFDTLRKYVKLNLFKIPPLNYSSLYNGKEQIQRMIESK